MHAAFSHLLRGLFAIVLTGHVFYMFCLARTEIGGFGFDLGVVILAVLFALVLLVPFGWIIALAEIPDLYVNQVRTRRWYQSGRCPQCGYDVSARQNSDVCSECGGTIAPPPPYRLSRATIQRFIIINLVAWAIGCAIGEAWLEGDEAAFRHEAREALKQSDQTVYARPRRWPFDSVMMTYREQSGARAADIMSDVDRE